MVTLKEIAQRAGVSVITVSRVLNDTHRNKVGAKTRAQVQRIAEEMGYHPNIPARALRGNRTYQFGLVVPFVDGSFIADIVQGLQDVAMEMQYSCLLYLTAFKPALELEIFRTLRQRNVDGVLWLPGPTREAELDDLLEELKVLQLLYSEVPGIHSILVDQERGGYEATCHLIGLGHRHIGILAGDDRHGKQRLMGYRRALEDAGIEPREAWIKVGPTNWEGGRTGASELLALDPRPSALVCYSDLVAWGALRSAQEHGLVVPDDLSLVGYDDLPYIQYVETPITTVAQPKRELGELAMNTLIRMIDGDNVQDSVLMPWLVTRSSTTAPKRNPAGGKCTD